jgi:hypothetical protein
MIFGIEAAKDSAEVVTSPIIPREWVGQDAQILLPSYPWPEGVK